MSFLFCREYLYGILIELDKLLFIFTYQKSACVRYKKSLILSSIYRVHHLQASSLSRNIILIKLSTTVHWSFCKTLYVLSNQISITNESSSFLFLIFVAPYFFEFLCQGSRWCSSYYQWGTWIITSGCVSDPSLTLCNPTQ